MASSCEQELCPNWSGDGNVCPCALFDLPRPQRHDCGHTCCDDRANPYHDHFLAAGSCPACVNGTP